MQQHSCISPHPRTLHRAYSSLRPQPAQLCKQRSEDLRSGLGLSDANTVQKLLQLAASQPLLTQLSPPKLTVSRETIDICSTSFSDIKMLQGSVTTVKDGSMASDIAKPSEAPLPSIASSIQYFTLTPVSGGNTCKLQVITNISSVFHIFSWYNTYTLLVNFLFIRHFFLISFQTFLIYF